MSSKSLRKAYKVVHRGSQPPLLSHLLAVSSLPPLLVGKYTSTYAATGFGTCCPLFLWGLVFSCLPWTGFASSPALVTWELLREAPQNPSQVTPLVLLPSGISSTALITTCHWLMAHLCACLFTRTCAHAHTHTHTHTHLQTRLPGNLTYHHIIPGFPQCWFGANEQNT